MPTNDYLPYLQHHGILGMKRGVRRYQNEDGSLTSAGRRRYGKEIKNEINASYRKNLAKYTQIKRENKSKAMSDAIEAAVQHIKEDISSNRGVSKKTMSDFKKASLDALKYDPGNLEPDTLDFWDRAVKQEEAFEKMDKIGDRIVKSMFPSKFVDRTARKIGREAIAQLGSDIWDKNTSTRGGIVIEYSKK